MRIIAHHDLPVIYKIYGSKRKRLVNERQAFQIILLQFEDVDSCRRYDRQCCTFTSIAHLDYAFRQLVRCHFIQFRLIGKVDFAEVVGSLQRLELVYLEFVDLWAI